MRTFLAFSVGIQCLFVCAVAGDTCGLFSQSGLVVRNRLYFQGGFYQTKDGTNAITPPNLQWLQLDQPFAVEGDVPGNITQGKALETSSDPQQQYIGTGGVLWTDVNGTFIYRMAGFSGDNNQGQATLPAYNVARDQWQSISVSGGNFNRFDRHYSMHASNTEAGGALSFVSGGQDYVGGMVVFNSTNPQQPSWKNSTNSELPYFYSAVSEYVRYGSAGVVVSVGGFVTESSRNAVAQRRTMNSVQVYDIAGDKWSTIYTTGDSPPARSRSCSALTAAPDDSSFVLTVYGGWDETKALNDVWQLIMPAFHWIKLDTTGIDSGFSNAGRMDHVCAAVNNGRSMLVLGGKSSLAPKSTKCDAGYPALRLLDLTTLQWQSTYNPNQTRYSVPKAVSDIVGGGPDGGARAASAWSETLRSTQALFIRTIPKYDPNRPVSAGISVSTVSNSTSSSGGTNTSAKKSISPGAIAGAVAGGVLGIAALAAGAWWILQRKRRRKMGAIEEVDSTVYGNGMPPMQERKFLSEAMGDTPLKPPIAEMDSGERRAELPGATIP